MRSILLIGAAFPAVALPLLLAVAAWAEDALPQINVMRGNRRETITWRGDSPTASRTKASPPRTAGREMPTAAAPASRGTEPRPRGEDAAPGSPAPEFRRTLRGAEPPKTNVLRSPDTSPQMVDGPNQHESREPAEPQVLPEFLDRAENGPSSSTAHGATNFGSAFSTTEPSWNAAGGSFGRPLVARPPGPEVGSDETLRPAPEQVTFSAAFMSPESIAAQGGLAATSPVFPQRSVAASGDGLDLRTALTHWAGTLLAVVLGMLLMLPVMITIARRAAPRESVIRLEMTNRSDLPLQLHTAAGPPEASHSTSVDLPTAGTDEPAGSAARRGVAIDLSDTRLPTDLLQLTWADQQEAETRQREAEDRGLLKCVFEANRELHRQLADLPRDENCGKGFEKEST